MPTAVLQHPTVGFSGYVRAAGRGIFFSLGFSGRLDLSPSQVTQLTALGFGVNGSTPAPSPDPLPQYVLDSELAAALANLPAPALPSRLSEASLRAAFQPKWKPNTDYAQGEPVVNPTGQLVTALTAFTSGPTYDGTKWSVPSSGAGSASGVPAALGILRAGLAARQVSPCRLVFAGSSTTAGQAASSEATRYVNRMVTALQAAYPSGSGSESTVVASTSATWGTVTSTPGVHGYNAGEGATVSADYLIAAERTRVAALNPRMVLHMIGANDYSGGVPVATFKANVLAVLADLQSKISTPLVQVLVQTYPKFNTFTPVAPWTDYGKALSEIAAADPDRIVYFDISPAYALVGVPGADPLDLIDTDNVHQLDSGHALMADLLLEKLGVQRGAAMAGSAGTPGVSGVFVVDTFTGTDGAALTSRSGQTGASWSTHPSVTTGVAQLLAGRVISNNASSARSLASGIPAVADYTVEADFYFAEVPTGTTLTAGIAGRYDPTAQTGYYVRYLGGTGYRLDKVIAGTQTTLATGSGGPAPVVGGTQHAKLVMAGSSVKVVVENVEVASVTDASITAKGRAAYLGTGVMTATTGVHIDNLTATTA